MKKLILLLALSTQIQVASAGSCDDAYMGLINALSNYQVAVQSGNTQAIKDAWQALQAARAEYGSACNPHVD